MIGLKPSGFSPLTHIPSPWLIVFRFILMQLGNKKQRCLETARSGSVICTSQVCQIFIFMHCDLWQWELAACSGSWWSGPQLCHGPTGIAVGWWISPSCVFSGSFLSLPLATFISACCRLIYLQKKKKKGIEKMTRLNARSVNRRVLWLGAVIDLLHILPQFISVLRIIFALWKAILLGVSCVSRKRGKKRYISKCYMK